MIKGLAGGVLAGAVAAVAGLAVLSQLSPPPTPFAPEASPGPAVGTAAEVVSAPAPEPAPELAPIADAAPVVAVAAPAPEATVAEPAAPATPDAATASPAPVDAADPPAGLIAATEAPVVVPAPAPEVPAPQAPAADAPAVVAAVPAAPPLTEPAAPAALPAAPVAPATQPEAPAVTMAPATSPLPTPAPALPEAPAPAEAVALVVPAAPVGPAPEVQDAAPEVAALTDPVAPAVEAPVAPASPAVAPPQQGAVTPPPAADAPPLAGSAPAQPAPPAPETEVAQAADAAPGLLNRPAPLAPAPGLGDAEGVRVGRLPAIGAEALVPAETPAAEVAPDATPLQRFARAFENPSGKPLFSIVLIDTGEPALDRAALAALPFPVTFALDPQQPGADLAATIYRDGGQEVVILVQSLPEGATASDVAVNMESLAGSVPEAVAVMDGEQGGFQSNRVLAGQVVSAVAAQGRAILSWDRGLNAAAQVARREGVAGATILRSIDAEGESAAIMRRYLDRAAFKAVQDGRVVVAGRTQAETVAVLLEWAVEGRASSVTLAPVSAVVRP